MLQIRLRVTAVLVLQIQLLVHRLHTLVAVVLALKGKLLVQAKVAAEMEPMEILLLALVLPTRVVVEEVVDMQVVMVVLAAQAVQALSS